MFGTLKHLAKTFRAPAAAERELIYITVATDRYDLEARARHMARLNRARAFGY